MPLTVVVGGFFGDEGKGKISAYLALKDDVDMAVRTGSVNAGHTVVFNGKRYKLRLVPSAFVNERTRLLIGPGANINPEILINEIKSLNVENRIGIDPLCSIIEEKHIIEDRKSAFLSKKIGTTGQGVGPAIEDRVRRRAKLAKDLPELRPYITDVPLEINRALDEGKKVIIEGTQGLFLSLYYGTYPYVTSRDTSASGVCSEAGVGPKRVDHVIVVFKAYVTRVGGGPLTGELSMEEAMRRGWIERATVTGRVRRVAPFNITMARRAVMINSATQVAITKIDVLYPNAKGLREYDELPKEAKAFIETIEKQLGVPVTLIGTGEDVHDVIDRREELNISP
ncbi:MAG: adenylosuccinate synthetase [Thermoprotei archaeon]|nr:MAG: adenylosuccinate synthetase [Thermoprotei archaeon]RLF20396.1 MAG: adenylosuccinate synthetase [Thermoprotei archaeon]